jgi:sterol desaturase/sphingolipid hydroxylase (fatty acid hydroxylase superfamily)
VTLLGIVLCVVASCLFAEFAGYWLHRLLHSGRFPALSRSHMIHHLLVYGPRQPMRTNGYKDATDDRPSIGNVGLEWLAPSAAILAACWGAMSASHVPRPYQALSLLCLGLWPLFTFNYLHDRMHLQNFWMTKNRVIKLWFLKARRLHDIHHRGLNDVGKMDTNFGIGFYFFDRVFGTIATHHRPFNWAGFEAAKLRYDFSQGPKAPTAGD